MISVLLSDSDLDNIRNFRTYIRTNFNDMRIVGTESNSPENIIDMVRELKPRLVIADIRFFGPGSHKAIEEIYERFPSTRFILYGSHNDEAYMKRCMDYGVIETIFRPVRPAELGRALTVAHTYLEKLDQEERDEKALIDSYKEKMYLFEYISLNSIINGHLKNEDEIRYAFQYFNFDFQSGFTVFVLRIDHFRKIILALDEMEKHVLVYRMLLIIKKTLGSYQSESIISGFHSITTVINGTYPIDEMIRLWETVIKEIHNKTRLSVTIGMGRTYERASDICVSYKEADAALRYRFLIGHSTVIPIHYVEPDNSITYRYPLEREERLVYAAAIGQYEYCRMLLKEICDALRKCGPLPDRLLPKIVTDIVISINRYLSEQNIDLGGQFNSFFVTKDILEIKEIDSAFDYMDGALKKFCSHLLRHRDDSDNRLYTAAKKYISERYYEPFSLQKISMNVGATPDYLNKIFLEREKITLFDYALNTRMNEAKRLMRETGLDDDMIAVKVGYDDGRHFQSVFRQHEGIHSHDYRNSAGGHTANR